jgi:hypothetical protein
VAAGDTNGDGLADIVTGAGAGGGPNVAVYSGSDLAVLQNFFAYDPAFAGGVRVGTVVGVSGRGEIVTGPGLGGGPNVRVFDGPTLTDLEDFFAFNPQFTGGIFVG